MDKVGGDFSGKGAGGFSWRWTFMGKVFYWVRAQGGYLWNRYSLVEFEVDSYMLLG